MTNKTNEELLLQARARSAALQREIARLEEATTPRISLEATSKADALHRSCPVIFGRRKDQTATKTPWRRMGDIKRPMLLNPPDLSNIWRIGYEHGEEASTYGMQCSGLRDLSAELVLPLRKHGSAEDPNLEFRKEELARENYGGWRRIDGHFQKERGWSKWDVVHTDLLFDPHPLSPISVVERGLRVVLPKSLKAREFGIEFRNRLAPCSLSSFINSKMGRQHLLSLGIDSRTAYRYTPKGFGSGKRYDLAREIYISRPREDMSRFFLIMEAIVADHLRHHDPQRYMHQDA